MRRFWTCWLLSLLIGCGANVNSSGHEHSDAAPQPLRVTSFNIRLASGRDGPNRWELRRELLVDTIQRADADLIGLQEVEFVQVAAVRAAMSEYGFVGVGRADGKEAGEFSPILFRSDRFEKLDSGHFWLSQTPEAIGSTGWDAKIPRIVTWVKLRDRRAGGRTLLFVNTHWDHMGKLARLESAKLMRQRLAELAPNEPIIITGDFNCTEDDPPHAVMTSGDAEPKLLDSFRQVHPQRSRGEATFNGFEGRSAGSRIDWILHTPHFATAAASIDRFNVDGRYPSDHFPVHAELSWR